jgi:glycosyltransferase involved in cell wall biosynthesis
MTRSIRKPWKWPKFSWYFLLLPYRVRRAIKGADLIVAHWWIPCGVAAAKVVSTGTELDVICHGTDLYWLRKHPSVARRFASATKSVTKWQCVSVDLKNILLKLYPEISEETVHVEPMPIGPEFYNMKITRDPRQIVSCGALIPRKNFDRLIEAVNQLQHVHLTIFGEGPERERLERLIIKYDLADRVKLTGNVSREELNKAFNTASLFVLVSDDEGYGMVLKEAQTAGCPTMAYATDGMIDTDLDFPIDKSDSITEKIREVLKDRLSE